MTRGFALFYDHRRRRRRRRRQITGPAATRAELSPRRRRRSARVTIAVELRSLRRRPLPARASPADSAACAGGPPDRALSSGGTVLRSILRLVGGAVPPLQRRCGRRRHACRRAHAERRHRLRCRGPRRRVPTGDADGGRDRRLGGRNDATFSLARDRLDKRLARRRRRVRPLRNCVVEGNATTRRPACSGRSGRRRWHVRWRSRWRPPDGGIGGARLRRDHQRWWASWLRRRRRRARRRSPPPPPSPANRVVVTGSYTRRLLLHIGGGAMMVAHLSVVRSCGTREYGGTHCTIARSPTTRGVEFVG